MVSNRQWLKDNSDFYVGRETVFSGLANAITGLTADGKLAANFTIAGGGNDVEMGPDGLIFRGGKYVNFDPVNSTHKAALIVADFTRDAAPSLATGDIIRFANSPTSNRLWIRYQATRNLLIRPSSKNVLLTDGDFSYGVRSTIALTADWEDSTYQYIDYDGSDSGVLASDPVTALTHDRTFIGVSSNITIHNIAMFWSDPGVALNTTIAEAWDKVKNIDVPTSARRFSQPEDSVNSGIVTTPRNGGSVGIIRNTGIIGM